MSLNEIYSLFRRHIVVLAVVMIAAAGMAWDIQDTPLTYEQSATVVFVAPGANPYSALGHDLIPTTSLMTATITGAEYSRKIRAAGGTAASDIAMVNLYNQQFPDYGVPYVTVTTESSAPASVGRTFDIIIQMLRELVSERQVQAGVPRWNFISIRVVGDTGVHASAGSRMRALAGLALLTLMALFMVAVFVERRSPRAGWRSSRRRTGRLLGHPSPAG